MTLLPTRARLIRYVHSVLIRQHTVNKIITLSEAGVLTILMKAHLQSEAGLLSSARIKTACFSSTQCRTNQSI